MLLNFFINTYTKSSAEAVAMYLNHEKTNTHNTFDVIIIIKSTP